MVWPPRLPKSKEILAYPAMFQFGQPGVSNALARTACTDTAVQMIVQYYKDRTHTLNDIRRKSGKGVDGEHGLTINEALKALVKCGVWWYQYARNIDATFALQKAYTGPVLVGVGYYKYPAKKGANCGQGNLSLYGGRTDCGFGGAHAILVLDNKAIKDAQGNIVSYDAFTRDPDHHTGTGPRYDRMRGSQLKAAIEALDGSEGWTETFALYPTKKK